MKVFTKNRGIINIEDINIGDEIKNSYGFNKVINKFDSGEKNELLIRTKGGYELKCSKEHALLSVAVNDSFIYKKVEDMKIGDCVCIDRTAISCNTEPTISVTLAWFLGLLVGDGHYSGSNKKSYNRVELAVFGEDHEIYDKLTILENEFAFMNLKIHKYSGGRCSQTKRLINMYRIIIDNKNFREYLESLGLKRSLIKENKNTPDIIWKSNAEIQSAYIRGMMDSDGSVDKKRGSIRFVNKSEFLVKELSLLLLYQGIVCNIIKNKYYTLSIEGLNCEIYKKCISFGVDRKQLRLENIRPKEGKTNNDNIPFKQKIKEQILLDFDSICSGKDPYLCSVFNQFKYFSYKHLRECIKKYTDYNNIYKNEKEIPSFMKELDEKHLFFDEIEEIINNNQMVQMYDLEVETNHEFTCNGFVVHNSQGSTYENCFVMSTDISYNKRKDEKDRILYTAMTRPKKMLYIL
jgi:intein/homing endonuclease